MFRCQVTNKVVSGRQYQIINRLRPRRYFHVKEKDKFREVNEMTLERIKNNISMKDREEFLKNNIRESHGFEPIEVLNVSHEIYLKHLENGGKVC